MHKVPVSCRSFGARLQPSVLDKQEVSSRLCIRVEAFAVMLQIDVQVC